ncbi:MAG TPA: hypothetical protein PL051_00620 [Candidatus Saccharibacteria bacterium]|nr:hypothetical protein [Candidatus Saccharibacteria bacterium]
MNNQIVMPTPVTDKVNNEWVALVDFGDGKLVQIDVNRAVLLNDKRHIAMMWGESPMSTSDFRYAQAWRVGGGGAATIMWSRDPEGTLYVGGVLQSRPFIDTENPVFNIARGLTAVGEAVRDAALRELDEEVNQLDLLVPLPLPGDPVNMDSAFFGSQGEGWNGMVEFFHVEVPWDLLVKQDDGSFVFRIENDTVDKQKEAIFGAMFVPATTTTSMADAFTIIATAKLRDYLAS